MIFDRKPWVIKRKKDKVRCQATNLKGEKCKSPSAKHELNGQMLCHMHYWSKKGNKVKLKEIH